MNENIVKCDDSGEIFEICGTKFSKDLFKAWGQNGLPLNVPFMFVENECGVKTIQVINFDILQKEK